MLVDWTTFKGFVDDRGLSIQWIDIKNTYFLKAFDAYFNLDCVINKVGTPGEGTPQKVFEDSYKSYGNAMLQPLDSDYAPLRRHKITKSGWGLHCHSISFQTSLLNSLYEKDNTGADFGWSTIKFYNSSSEELTTQGDINTYCVETEVSFEPDEDYEIIGGGLYQLSAPASAFRCWFWNPYSGHEFCTGGLDLRFTEAKHPFIMDGRTAKFMPYSATYHFGKLVFIASHTAGYQHELLLKLDIFTA